MSLDVFSFMRATYYRWAQSWNKCRDDFTKAPSLLAVGDLHIENFGTWRDQEGRLIWGINDFDETSTLPYTNDLVRLAVSARLAISAARLKIRPIDASKAILEGYAKGIAEGGRAYVLSERNRWLRSTVMTELRDPTKFWEKLEALPTIRHEVPAKVRKVLEAALPRRKLGYRLLHRIAGLGSLGRQRIVALTEWNGGQIAREAKALIPSACVWAKGQPNAPPHYEEIVSRAIRCPDPFLELRRGWVVRRLAPDCSRVELSMLSKDRDEYKLLLTMGGETANVHLGSKRAIAKVLRDLKRRPNTWLNQAAKTMSEAVIEDWQDWRRSTRPPGNSVRET